MERLQTNKPMHCTQRTALVNQRSHHFRTPMTDARPSLYPLGLSEPSGSPRMALKNQKAAATQAAIATPKEIMGERRLIMTRRGAL